MTLKFSDNVLQFCVKRKANSAFEQQKIECHNQRDVFLVSKVVLILKVEERKHFSSFVKTLKKVSLNDCS